MITIPGSDSQEVGPLADRMPRKRSTRFVARRRAETGLLLCPPNFSGNDGICDVQTCEEELFWLRSMPIYSKFKSILD
jgi:hypothetical protein